MEVGESGTRPLESAPGRLAALLVSLQVLSAAHPGMAWHHLASQIHITLIPSKLGAGLPGLPGLLIGLPLYSARSAVSLLIPSIAGQALFTGASHACRLLGPVSMQS